MMEHAQNNPLAAITETELLCDAAYIDGAWVRCTQTFDVLNPADGSLVGTVPLLGSDHAKQAVTAAAHAQRAWAAKTGKERGDILRRWKTKNPRDYLQHAHTEKRIGGDELITLENRPFDYMLNALRLSEGFLIRDFEVRTGLERNAIDKRLSHAKLMGWLEERDGCVKPTELGHRFSNDVMALFLAD